MLRGLPTVAAKTKVIPRTLSAHAPSVRPLHHGLRQCRSVQLHVSDRRLNTFITSFGHWHYTRAPQGFLSFGDGYNRRFDAVLSDFERKECGVDDRDLVGRGKTARDKTGSTFNNQYNPQHSPDR